MLKNEKVTHAIAEWAKPIAEKQVDAERWMQESGRTSFSDPRRPFDPDTDNFRMRVA